MGIVGLKEGYEKALEQANNTPHLQIQLMLKDTSGNIKPGNQAYIFRNSKENIKNDNTVYPSNGPLTIPDNTLGFIMFGLQHEYTDYEQVKSFMKGFDPNQLPTGIEHGASHISIIYPPQFFTFSVFLNGTLFKDGIESRYHHLYKSINFGSNEDGTKLVINSIVLNESLYKIIKPEEKYTEYLATAILQKDN